MAQVTLRKVVKMYDEVQAVRGIDLDITDKEFIMLVGPSGCGKSTTLRMIAGLEEISGGDIAIGGDVVNDVPPKDRDIAMVFQNYALYPHMNVYENMSFGLKLKKTPKAEIDQRVRAAAGILDITELLDRKPKQLSGGQRQRVAMGRAIVRDPKVFLFDEPLSNLDAKLRVAMRAEIKALHQRLKTTTVYVTHDQVEAMTMADKIVVMQDGRIEQIGEPLQLYDHPANLFVAQFIGSPAMNVVKGVIKRSNGSACVDMGDGVQWPLHQSPGAEGQPVAYGVRPGDLSLTDAGAPGAVVGEVVVVEPTGAETELLIQAGQAQLILVTHGRTSVNPGDRVGLRVTPGKVHVFDQGTGNRLAA